MKPNKKNTTKRKKAGPARSLSVAGGSAGSYSDTEMLDWLDKQGKNYGWQVQLPSDYPHVRDCVFISRNTTAACARETIREAIELKMGKPNNKAEPCGGRAQPVGTPAKKDGQ